MSKASPPDPVMELCGASPVTCLAFEEMGIKGNTPMLFSGHQDGKILCWDLKSQRIFKSLEGHAECVLWVASPSAHILFTQGREGVLKIWTATAVSWVLLSIVPTAAFTFCDSSLLDLTDHHLLFTPVEESGTISLHYLHSDFTLDVRQSLKSLAPTPQKEHGMSMKVCSFKNADSAPRLLVAYESGSLILWDAMHCVVLNKIQAHSDSIMCLNICSTKDPLVFKAVTGSVDTDLKSWLVSNDSLSSDLSVTLTNPGLGSLATRRDGRIFASGGWDGQCRIFTVAKLRPLAVLSNHKESVQCISFSPDNKLAAGSKDGYISLWDIYGDE